MYLQSLQVKFVQFLDHYGQSVEAVLVDFHLGPEVENAQRVQSCLLDLLMDLVILECGTFQQVEDLRFQTKVPPWDISTTYDFQFGVSLCCFTLPDSRLWLRFVEDTNIASRFQGWEFFRRPVVYHFCRSCRACNFTLLSGSNNVVLERAGRFDRYSLEFNNSAGDARWSSIGVVRKHNIAR